MPEKKIIAIVGATGAQGGGLVRAITERGGGEFEIRAITRDAQSEKAKDLKGLGAEVVEANLDDKPSVVAAFKGTFGAFCVTNFWEHFSPEKEMLQARTMAQAAAETGLQHVIWSTFEDTRKLVPLSDQRMPTLQQKYKVPHFDGKGEANHYYTELGVPTTFLLTSFYWENLIHFGMGPKVDKNGNLVIAFPLGDKKLPGIAAQDIGGCALGIFRQGLSLVGQTVGVAGEHLTGEQMARALGKAIGRPVSYEALDPNVYRALGFPGADDLGNMFQYKRDFETEYCGVRSITRSRELNPSLQSFETWLEQNWNRIPL